MKEFALTQPYATTDEMINSAEVGVYKEELRCSNEEDYAIVSRIGNRYDLFGNKIERFAKNPFMATTEKLSAVQEIQKEEQPIMKYAEIETLIDNEVAKAVAEVKVAYEQQIINLKVQHDAEIANVKENVKAELIARLNA